MSTNEITSLFVHGQFPAHVRETGDQLIQFLQAYYESQEQANTFIEVAKNLREYQDIDDSYSKYIDYIEREIMPNIPKTILADRQLLAKHIIDLYRSKGAETSYHILFRLLFNEELSQIYYPGEDILRASDGRWSKETGLIIERITGDIEEAVGNLITGGTSGATAIVDRYVSTLVRGSALITLYLINVNGTFQESELVSNSDSSVTFYIISNDSGPLQSLTVINGGAGHVVGDTVRVDSDLSGSGAFATVDVVSSTSAIEFAIANSGSGYEVATTVYEISNTGGVGAAFTIDSIKDTEVIGYYTDIISDVQNVQLDGGGSNVSFSTAGANSVVLSANLAIANVNTTLASALAVATTTVGGINAITTTSFGYGYDSIPTVTVTNPLIAEQLLDDGYSNGTFKGQNAVIEASYVEGSIANVSITIQGTSYNNEESVTLVNVTRAANNASALAYPSGIIDFPGKYLDTKGWLSWDKFLQDNRYYQEFSYELRSTHNLIEYENTVKNIMHPSGTALFGGVYIESVLDVTPTANASLSVE